MSGEKLSSEDKRFLLDLARRSIIAAIHKQPLPQLDFDHLSPILTARGSAFVTLTRKNGELRGCIGSLEPTQSLVENVQANAVAAALEDYRFLPVKIEEMDHIVIEISRLTVPEPLPYEHPNELIQKIRPGIDGIVLKDGFRRATFLPQVWEKIPDPHLFLDQLCLKMGAPADLWQHKILTVLVYQVEEFHE